MKGSTLGEIAQDPAVLGVFLTMAADLVAAEEAVLTVMRQGIEETTVTLPPETYAKRRREIEARLQEITFRRERLQGIMHPDLYPLAVTLAYAGRLDLLDPPVKE